MTNGVEGYSRRMETGPIPDGVVSELEALKWRLAAMSSADDLPADQADAMRTEISAIRLHLKRLDLERQHVADDIEVRLGLRVPPEAPAGPVEDPPAPPA
jgi:hypothetical protein